VSTWSSAVAAAELWNPHRWSSTWSFEALKQCVYENWHTCALTTTCLCAGPPNMYQICGCEHLRAEMQHMGRARTRSNIFPVSLFCVRAVMRVRLPTLQPIEPQVRQCCLCVTDNLWLTCCTCESRSAVLSCYLPSALKCSTQI